jgi:hypothetical protein
MSSRHLVLTSQDGSPGDVDNVCCQTGDNFLYYFKGARSAPCADRAQFARGISPPERDGRRARPTRAIACWDTRAFDWQLRLSAFGARRAADGVLPPDSTHH